MYKLEDIRDIRSGYGITLVLFNDGDQFCSHCPVDINPVDYFEEYDELRNEVGPFGRSWPTQTARD